MSVLGGLCVPSHTWVYLDLCLESWLIYSRLCVMFVHSQRMLLLTTLHMGNISKISFQDAFYLLPQISNPLV